MLWNKLDKFSKNGNGSISVIAAMIIPMVILGALFAIDLTNNTAKSEAVKKAADAAVLAALQVGKEKYDEKRRSVGRKNIPWRRMAKEAGREFFSETLESKGIKGGRIWFDFTVEESGTIILDSKFISDVEWMTPLPGLVKKIKGSSQGIISPPKNVRITFLVDNSGSMAIGATAEDQKKMYYGVTNSYDGSSCTFACHVPRNESEFEFRTEAMRATGARLRMDVVRDTVGEVMRMLDAEDDTNIEVAIYTFSVGLEEYAPLTTNLRSVNVSDLDLMDYSFSPDEVGGTYIHHALTELEGEMKQDDDTLSFLIFLSDGVETSERFTDSGDVFPNNLPISELQRSPNSDWVNSPGYKGSRLGTVMQSFDPANCEPIKKNGNTIYTIQTEYTITPEMFEAEINGGKSSRINYINSLSTDGHLQNAFSSCATSPEHHFIVSEVNDIKKAFEDVIGMILKETPPRISQ